MCRSSLNICHSSPASLPELEPVRRSRESRRWDPRAGSGRSLATSNCLAQGTWKNESYNSRREKEVYVCGCEKIKRQKRWGGDKHVNPPTGAPSCPCSDNMLSNCTLSGPRVLPSKFFVCATYIIKLGYLFEPIRHGSRSSGYETLRRHVRYL